MTAIRIDHVNKSFGETVALDDIDLTIEAGELFFLLGPERVRQEHAAAADRGAA